MAEPPALRASDREREATVARLREAAGEGRLTLEELTDRVGFAYEARTHAELAALTGDLPAAPAEPAGGVAPVARGSEWVVAVMGGADRKGRWRPRPRTNVVAVMGGVDIDLRDAELTGAEIEIVAVAVMGGVDVLVPEGVHVVLEGFALMGGNDNRAEGPPPPPGAPVVRVRAYSLMGGVDIKTQRLRERLQHHLHGPRPPAPPRLPPG